MLAVLVRNACEGWGDVLCQCCSNRGLLQVPVELSQDLHPVAFSGFFSLLGISVLLCSCDGRLDAGLDEQLVENLSGAEILDVLCRQGAGLSVWSPL